MYGSAVLRLNNCKGERQVDVLSFTRSLAD